MMRTMIRENSMNKFLFQIVIDKKIIIGKIDKKEAVVQIKYWWGCLGKGIVYPRKEPHPVDLDGTFCYCKMEKVVIFKEEELRNYLYGLCDEMVEQGEMEQDTAISWVIDKLLPEGINGGRLDV